METYRWPEAVACYKKVTEYDPLRTTGWMWLAKSLFETEGVDRAIEVLNYALGLDKQHENFEPVLKSYLRECTAIAAQRMNLCGLRKYKTEPLVQKACLGVLRCLKDIRILLIDFSCQVFRFQIQGGADSAGVVISKTLEFEALAELMPQTR